MKAKKTTETAMVKTSSRKFNKTLILGIILVVTGIAMYIYGHLLLKSGK
jgi:hypothetical protein